MDVSPAPVCGADSAAMPDQYFTQTPAFSTYPVTMNTEDSSVLDVPPHASTPVLYKNRDTLSLHFDVSTLQSEMRIDSPDDLVLEYTQAMMGVLLFKPEPKNIGMIGLGGGSLAKFCYRFLQKTSIEVAEIDAAVIGLRRTFHIPDDDERLSVRCMDGADFVCEAEDRFDVLLVDGFDKSGQPPQLCSQQFYDACHNSLAQNGIMVVNLLAAAPDTDIYVERMRLAFDDRLVVIDTLDSLNKIIFACKGNALQVDDATLRRRMRQLKLIHPLVVSLTAQNIMITRR
ncbi:fused MFS/spermidine synthase [Noviherbaspirillum autotrophicum]|uniref:fused MFS/spermidine synthase n=1 Tax=Noviherbaspirillum autotrophicum TaxID=709839 RepID=UPI0009FBCAF1|nr:fused MFS/spermidine synthase [Noviherbaspirillum autotrophicum]